GAGVRAGAGRIRHRLAHLIRRADRPAAAPEEIRMEDLFDVSDRLAFVTGSSRGLGRALALTLARAGARLVVHGRNPEAVEATRAAAETLRGSAAMAACLDVAGAAGLEAGVARSVDTPGVLDILVNNAGIQRRAPIDRFAVSEWYDIV